MDEEKRNTLIFFVLSLAVILGYPYFFGDSSRTVQQQAQQTAAVIDKSVDALKNTMVQAAGRELQQKQPAKQAKIENIEIKSAKLSGSICSKGVRFDNVVLNDYKEKIDASAKVSVFKNSQGAGKGKYFAENRWESEDKSVLTPDENTCWEVGENKVLTEKTPVTLTWDNQQGLLFEKKLSVDENYVITTEDKVRNYGEKPCALKLVMNIHRDFEKKPEDSSIAYEGPIGYLNGKAEQVKYEEIAKKARITHETEGGWFGISDKYWLAAFIPNQKDTNSVTYCGNAGGTSFDVSCSSGVVAVPAYGEAVKVNNLYLGAKEINTLDMYETKLGIKHFDLAIDFGWMYVLTKPGLYLLAYAKDLVGNMGLGILLITLLLKLLLFPLSNKSYRSMNKMREVQPKLKQLQDRYGNDKMRLSQEMQSLYKKEGINPMGGCLPMLLQWPILFALYKVLYISIEMRQAPFFGWIHDLSQADPLYILNLGGLIPVDLPGFLQIGIWPLLMGLTMLLQQKLSPAPADPSQEKMMLIMPILFTFMFGSMPAGLIIYWTFSNLLNIFQQYLIMRLDARTKALQIAQKRQKK